MSQSPDTKELQERLGVSRTGRTRRVVRWVVEALCRRDAPSQRDDPPVLEAVANPAS